MLNEPLSNAVSSRFNVAAAVVGAPDAVVALTSIASVGGGVTDAEMVAAVGGAWGAVASLATPPAGAVVGVVATESTDAEPQAANASEPERPRIVSRKKRMQILRR